MAPAARPIQIGCPEHGQFVRGQYVCAEDGQFCFGPDGCFLLAFVRCDQGGGRCAQTLCALHRLNRRGPQTWFPDRIRYLPFRQNAPARRKEAPPSPSGGSTISFEA